MIRPISLIVAAVLLLGPILVVELGVRSLIDRGRLPEAPSTSDLADVSLANLRRTGKSDVLVVGMSTVRNAIKPDTLERRIEASLGRPVSVQNVAQGGISLESQRLIVQQLAKKELLPAVVITGLSPVSLAGEHEGDHVDWFRRSELGQLWSGCPEGPLEVGGLECRLSEVSALWRWRSRPGKVTEAITQGMPDTVVDGWRTLRPSGWLAAKPSTAARLDSNLSRALERLDDGIDVSDETVASWVAFIDELRAHDVEVVAVRMPYYEPLVEALVERNPAWVTERDAGYDRLAEAAGVPIVAVSTFEQRAEAPWFRDPRHLSRLGAASFTRQLWDEAAVSEPVLAVLGSAG